MKIEKPSSQDKMNKTGWFSSKKYSGQQNVLSPIDNLSRVRIASARNYKAVEDLSPRSRRNQT